MQMFTAIVALSVAAGTASCSPLVTRQAYAVKETHYVPQKWSSVGVPPKDHMLHLQIGLKQDQYADLERQLLEISHPDHPRYGQHLTAEQVNELIKPADKTLDLVHEWLNSHGIDTEDLSYSPAQDWIEIDLPVQMVESLLNTEYRIFKHVDGDSIVRTTKWSLPEHLHEHIDTIQPTTSFMRANPLGSTAVILPQVIEADSRKRPSNATIAAACNLTLVTPECFSVLYGTKGYIPSSTNGNRVGFNNFLGEIPIRPDAAQFLLRYKPEAVPSAYDFKQIDIRGGPSQDGPLTAKQAARHISREANLDVQAIAGISYPVPITAYSTGGSPPFLPDIHTPENSNEPYLKWVTTVLASSDIPQVISTSYGDDEQTIPRAYAQKVCNMFAQLGARGVSLLFSSGDSGVGATGTCYSNDGKNSSMFIPIFPGSCPWVTTVGATYYFQPEIAVNLTGYSTGGGFSNYFPRPTYQDEHVPAYVSSLGSLYSGLYNQNGRGYPDISAQGLYFAYVWNGTFGRISGTSASAPLMAGIISLVNDNLIAAGRPVLGFLNPWLYSKGHQGFTDILAGSARGCNVLASLLKRDGMLRQVSGRPFSRSCDLSPRSLTVC